MIPKTAIAATASLTVLLAAQTARAQAAHIYDVKVICGQAAGKIAAPGLYWTAVNVLNPNSETIKVEARVAVALPGFTMGPLSPPKIAPLRPDRAFEIDCPSLMGMSDAKRFLKGYVTLRSEAPLVVVAVYTQADRDKRAVSIHTERVAPRPRAGCPDLRVRSIERPSWDAAAQRSVIKAVIENVGSVDAPSTLARLIDPSTSQPTGAPYNDVVDTGPIPAGGSVTMTFHLPYWVYNPDADLEVTADYKGQLEECDERNNKAEFHELG